MARCWCSLFMYGFVLGRAEREASTHKKNDGNHSYNTHHFNHRRDVNGNDDKPICEIVRTYPRAYASLFVGLCEPIPGLVRDPVPSAFPNTSVRLRETTCKKVQTYLWSCARLPAVLCKPMGALVRRLAFFFIVGVASIFFVVIFFVHFNSPSSW